jgi:hypothetical protein
VSRRLFVERRMSSFFNNTISADTGNDPPARGDTRLIGALLAKIRDLKRDLRDQGIRVNLPELTVLSRANDPYLLSDGLAGQWFAEQVQRFKVGVIHLRGLFYLCVAAGDVYRPNGKNGGNVRFDNTHEQWVWFTKIAAKNARWLGYVPFSRIIDERNAPPELFIPERQFTDWNMAEGIRVEVPSLDALLPEFSASVAAVQPYRIILIGEKVSLKQFLKPIAERVGGELLLPTGEISDTQIAALAARCEEDGRPAVVLYFSDFDPAGWQMPISVARKLQALRDMNHPDLRIELHHVALSLEQAADLPSTPLKETEKRGDKWKEVMGREQTEIDALIVLRPTVLTQIAERAVAPFYDHTLARRAAEVRAAWKQKVEELLAESDEFQAAKAAIAEARNFASHAVQKIEDTQTQAKAVLEDMGDLPELEEPEPELTGTAPQPLFSTEYDDFTAAQKLKAYRAYEDEGDAE